MDVLAIRIRASLQWIPKSSSIHTSCLNDANGADSAPKEHKVLSKYIFYAGKVFIGGQFRADPDQISVLLLNAINGDEPPLPPKTPSAVTPFPMYK